MSNSSIPNREAARQSVTGFIKLQTPEQSIRIGFTDQKVSGRAGLLTFAGFLHWHRLGALLARMLPHQKSFNAKTQRRKDAKVLSTFSEWLELNQLVNASCPQPAFYFDVFPLRLCPLAPLRLTPTE